MTPLAGAHMSIEGGVHRAVERADAYGMTALQIFTRSARVWRPPPLPEEEAERFRARLASSGVRAVVAHATYLVNPASPDRNLRAKSERALVDELTRCERLGIPWLILHPGSHKKTTTSSGLRRASGVLSRVLRKTDGFQSGLLLENTAGQGDSLGSTFEELHTLLDAVDRHGRTGICLDTCHAFAAGHDLRGLPNHLSRVRAVHVNDSVYPRGSRRDRHAGLGEGRIGLPALRRLLRDPALRRLPLILETPKRSEGYVDLDAVNLARLRGFYRGAGRAAT